MKRWALLCGVVLLSAVAASAQGAPKVEVFGGYSYLHTSFSGTSFTANLNGGSASVSVNPTSWLGLVGDFGGYHGSTSATSGGINGEVYTYMFGPKTTFRMGRIHAIHPDALRRSSFVVGQPRTVRRTRSQWRPAAASIGMRREHVGVRLVQAEYLLTMLNDSANEPAE